jgi:hypothetical protein
MMPKVAMEAARLELPPADGYSKRERGLAAVAGKTRLELAQIARDLGRYLSRYELEEAGLTVLEEKQSPITEITRRSVAKCFGDDLSGERNVVELLQKLFPIGTIARSYVHSESLAEQIAQHMVCNRGD